MGVCMWSFFVQIDGPVTCFLSLTARGCCPPEGPSQTLPSPSLPLHFATDTKPNVGGRPAAVLGCLYPGGDGNRLPFPAPL